MCKSSAETEVIKFRLLQSTDLDTFLQLGSLTCGSLHKRENQSDTDLLERFTSFVKEFAFRPESEIWIAHSHSVPYIGHLWLFQTHNRFNGNKELWVWDISISVPNRNKGFGKVLMAYAKKRAEDLDFPELWLLVAEDNEIAKNLYLSCGYAPKAQMLSLNV
jgi:ribosomal protein S18 acetylase RimI-like enzyme